MEFNRFFLLGVCAIICTQSNFPTVIALVGTNVRFAREGEFPFIVALKHINTRNPLPNRDHICTAGLITKKHVLSAAQCVHNRQVMNTVVLYGTNVLISGPEYSIRWWIINNEWLHYRNLPIIDRESDIVIIRLRYEIEDDFQPPSLSYMPTEDLMGRFIELAGWGINHRRELSIALLTDNDAVVMSRAACQQHILQVSGQSVVIHERHFCSLGATFTLIQRGDFGGPVIHAGKIVGVNNKVLPDTRREFNHQKINIHTKISFYRDFITDVTRDLFNWI